MTLGKYNNSMNFVFGLSGIPADFDVLNNPYVEWVGYSFKQENNLYTWNQKYEVTQCQNSDYYQNVVTYGLS